MNHTPGPWKFGLGCPSAGFILYGSDGFVIARREVEETTDRNEEMVANARLIAAAPELYEELREILDYAREVYAQFGGDDEKRGRAPRIREDIVRVEALLKRLDGEDEDA